MSEIFENYSLLIIKEYDPSAQKKFTVKGDLLFEKHASLNTLKQMIYQRYGCINKNQNVSFQINFVYNINLIKEHQIPENEDDKVNQSDSN